jgi:hydrogenase-4 component F
MSASLTNLSGDQMPTLLTLLIAVPILAGLACWPVRRRAALEWINLIAAFLVLVFAGCLTREVLMCGTVEAFSGFLRADALSVVVLDLTAFVSFVCAIYAVGYLRHDAQHGTIDSGLLHRYYVLTPIFVGTMVAVPLVNNLGLLWVAIESTTLASVLLVRFYNQKSSLEAAWKYLIIGSAGIALALFGTVLAYFAAVPVLGEHADKAFYWSSLVAVADKCQPAAMRLAFIMVLIGYGTKAGIAPMHTWKPDAYAEAPVPSAALLGAASINCAIYGIMRFYTLTAKCLGHAYPGNLLIIFGVASILVAAPFVLVQRNFRRLLAYSSIDHAGIMVAALGFGGKLGALAAVLHMVFHAVAKPLMFFCAGNVQQNTGSPSLRRMSGLIHKLPWTATLFLVATFAVTGLPPFGLFQSELTALSAGLAAHRNWSAALFVAGIVTIFAGFLVHISKLVLGPSPRESGRTAECSWKLTAMLLVAVSTIMLGLVLPVPIGELIRRAALMIGGAQ